MLAVGDVVHSLLRVKVANLVEDDAGEELMESQDHHVELSVLEVEGVAYDDQELEQQNQEQDSRFDLEENLFERVAVQAHLEVQVGYVGDDDDVRDAHRQDYRVVDAVHFVVRRVLIFYIGKAGRRGKLHVVELDRRKQGRRETQTAFCCLHSLATLAAALH